MSNERVVKIFMASSDELEVDRAKLGNLIRHLNDMYRKYGIYIELFQWEYFDASYGCQGKQEEYNEKVRESDMFLAFFHKKAGEFTINEFDVALKHFGETAKPKVYTYVRDLEPEEKEEDSLKKFKERLYKDMGHYWCRYGNTDTMKLHFVLQFQLLEPDRHISSMEVKNSKVLLDNQPIADLNNVPFAANNDAFISMNKQKDELNKDISKYRDRLAEDPQNKHAQDDLKDALQKLEEVCKKLEQHEQYLFGIAKAITQKAGEACSARIRKAMELFEQGKAGETNGILNFEDIDCDIAIHLNIWERAEEQVKESRKVLLLNIEELLLKTKTALADDRLTMQERLEQVDKSFTRAIELQMRIDVHPEDWAKTLFDYAYFLTDCKRYDAAFPIYYATLDAQKILAKEYPEVYRPNIATILHNLATLHDTFNQYDLAEKDYTEALEIRRELVEKHPHVYRPDLAMTLNNLANLHVTLNQYYLAEKEYKEALEIYRELVDKHPDVYQPDVAIALNNLANLHVIFNQYDLAEKEYTEALEIDRTQADKHPEAYARTLYNLALFHKTINQYDLAEKEYTEALEIRRELAEEHPDAYQPDVAKTLNSLAVLHKTLNQHDLAEKEYKEALEIYRTLAEKYPDVYRPDVADTLYNLAILHDTINQHDLAEREYKEALEIYRTLVEKYPDVYQPDVANTLHNLAIVHASLNQYDLAEKEYTEAQEIKRMLQSRMPSTHIPPHSWGGAGGGTCNL